MKPSTEMNYTLEELDTRRGAIRLERYSVTPIRILVNGFRYYSQMSLFNRAWFTPMNDKMLIAV